MSAPSAHVAEALRVMGVEAAGLSALSAALEGPLAGPFHAAIETILAAQGRVIVTGIGKSGHIGRKIASTLASTGAPAHYVHPAEASHGDLGMIRAEDVILALSWSGETPELADLVGYARRFSVKLVAITSRADSALGRAADILLLLPRAEEACPNGLAPTTSTLMQLALGDALAMALLTAKGFSAMDFRDLHPGGKLGARLKKVKDLMHTGAEVPVTPLSANVREAIVEMTAKRFGLTAVVDGSGRLAGVFTDGDLRRALQRGAIDQPVSEVMTATPRTAGPEMLAQDALRMLNEANITAILVVENDRPVGVAHLHDFLRAGVA